MKLGLTLGLGSAIGGAPSLIVENLLMHLDGLVGVTVTGSGVSAVE